MNEQTKIREWYLSAYPEDELGNEINPNATFNDVFEWLDNYKDIYELIGVHDSLVRERIFSALSEVMNCDYDYIYDQWLKSA